MTVNQMSAFIIARPGPLRDGLQALMLAMPQIEVINKADDLRSAMQTSLERQPALVLLDADLAGSETWLAVRRVRARWPWGYCVFLANDVQQQQAAEAAGADVALPKGFPAGRLVAVLVNLLSRAQGEKVDGGIAIPTPRRNGAQRRQVNWNITQDKSSSNRIQHHEMKRIFK
jgi:DNA-binding NarL/FixJ family response regulator